MYLGSWISLLLATATPWPEAFDLHCRETIPPTAPPRIGRVPSEYHFRVSLAENRFCWEGCRDSRSIAAVRENVVELIEEDEGARHLNRVRIWRQGAASIVRFEVRYPGRGVSQIGACSFEPFSGFGDTAPQE
jgi:hypothetical protein